MLWLVSRPVFTNIKQSVDCVVDVGFRKFISNVVVDIDAQAACDSGGVLQ